MCVLLLVKKEEKAVGARYHGVDTTLLEEQALRAINSGDENRSEGGGMKNSCVMKIPPKRRIETPHPTYRREDGK